MAQMDMWYNKDGGWSTRHKIAAFVAAVIGSLVGLSTLWSVYVVPLASKEFVKQEVRTEIRPVHYDTLENRRQQLQQLQRQLYRDQREKEAQLLNAPNEQTRQALRGVVTDIQLELKDIEDNLRRTKDSLQDMLSNSSKP